MAVLASLCLHLQSCDTYESKVPIDKPAKKINEELLGTWEDPKEQNILLVTKKSDSLYRIDVEPGKNKNREHPIYLAYESDINGSTFLNVSPEDPDSNKTTYALYRFNYRSGILHFYKLSPFIREKFRTSAELKAFISFHMKNDYFFVKDSVLLLNRELIEKKDKEVQIYKREKLLKALAEEKDLVQRRLLLVILGACILILAIFLLYLRRKNKHDKIVADARIESLVRQQQLKSVNDMLDAQEHERVRIAGDLHDRLGSILSTIKLYFSSMEEQMETTKMLNKEYYDKTISLIDHACEEVRRISHDLVSGALVQFGLVAALKELFDTIEKTGRLTIESHFAGMNKRLDSATEITLFRVVQELLNNIIKHARARTVKLSFEKTAAELTIVITDDGIGFEPGTIRQGMGLNNVENRIHNTGGTVRLTSTRGKGTEVRISIPL